MDFWYRPSKTWQMMLLLPLAWIFQGIVNLRLWLYRCHIIKSTKFPVPVIVVGNITVGGTGKTPLVIWLADFLKANGFKPGIVSRGYGGDKQTTPIHVTAETMPQQVGDEACLMARRAHCPMVVCVNRVAAVKSLLETTDCDVVIADDGLQHYRLARDIEIAVVDAERQLGNRCLLPAGPLRESPSRLKEVDFIIQHGEPKKGVLTMQLVGNDLFAVADLSSKVSLNDFTHKVVHAVAGIGHPSRFFAALRKNGFTVIEHAFPDHYLYSAEDFQFKDSHPIIMTEKDAVKCQSFADERFWYLPVDVMIDGDLKVALLTKLSQ